MAEAGVQICKSKSTSIGPEGTREQLMARSNTRFIFKLIILLMVALSTSLERKFRKARKEKTEASLKIFEDYGVKDAKYKDAISGLNSTKMIDLHNKLIEIEKQ